MYGNRGVLHDRDGRIVRLGQVRRWLVCELEFRGRRRPLLRPGRYTELFFLDEAVALAAGHRPCAECRHPSYRHFRELWDPHDPPSAGAMDDVLHVERARDGGRRRTVTEPAGTLPDGTVVLRDGDAHVVVAGGTRRFAHDGWGPWHALTPGGTADVLTPPSTLAVLRSGYPVRLHPTAT